MSAAKRAERSEAARDHLAKTTTRRKWNGMANSFWVYILLCSDASYYIGVTRDVARRVAEHESGLDERSYTFMRRPVELVYAGEFNDPNSAIQFEKKIKGWTRKKKQALIDGDWDLVRALARE